MRTHSLHTHARVKGGHGKIVADQQSAKLPGSPYHREERTQPPRTLRLLTHAWRVLGSPKYRDISAAPPAVSA